MSCNHPTCLWLVLMCMHKHTQRLPNCTLNCISFTVPNGKDFEITYSILYVLMLNELKLWHSVFSDAFYFSSYLTKHKSRHHDAMVKMLLLSVPLRIKTVFQLYPLVPGWLVPTEQLQEFCSSLKFSEALSPILVQVRKIWTCGLKRHLPLLISGANVEPSRQGMRIPRVSPWRRTSGWKVGQKMEEIKRGWIIWKKTPIWKTK